MNVVNMRPQPEPGTFEEFWRAYPKPRRVGKLMCMNMWDEITSEAGMSTRILNKNTQQYRNVHLKATPQEIIAGTKAWETTIRKPGTYSEYTIEPRYMPLPETFLNQGRWLDYL